MNVSFSWLRQYVPVQMTAEDLAECLTMAGLEVDGLYERYDFLKDIRVGRILDVERHPQADNLSVCRVDIGTDTVSVVCGAPNVRRGMTSALAMPGAVLPDGTTIQKTVIRGQASSGMLCSESELSIGPDAGGIMDLSDTLRPGASLNVALQLSDTVLDIDLTPNRPDCLSMIGIAREAAAIQAVPMSIPEIQLPDAPGDIHSMTSVTIEAPDLCPRYAARLLENITIEPSPFWLQDRLLSVGLRPINNIVDVTNFVMLETGQPLHAFDFDRLSGHRIIVRTASEGERFKTLDGKERLLSDQMLMICDDSTPVAIGGIMGGYDSEIISKTRRVLLESACFNPSSIRKTAKKLGLNSDASHRFERGVDPDGTLYALNRAAQLILDISKGATLVGGLIDQHPGKPDTRIVTLDIQKTNTLLGTSLQGDVISKILQSVGFTIQRSTDKTLEVAVPSYRVDVTRPVDLVEEVARLYGYDKIQTTYPLIPAQKRSISPLFDLRRKIKQLLTGVGFTEALNYSFISKHSCERLNLPEDDPRQRFIHILNPLSEDQSVMRTSLVPGLLETMRGNLANQVKNLKLFEIGKTFISTGKDQLPVETEMITGLWTGLKHTPRWDTKDIVCDFYDLKGIVEVLLDGLNIPRVRFTLTPNEHCRYMRPGYTADIYTEKNRIGRIGEIHPRVLRNYDIKQTGYIFEINVSDLVTCIPAEKKAAPVPKFPAVTRDITIIVSKDIEANGILQFFEGQREKFIENIHLFDVYEGDPIPDTKKSLSIRITYRSTTGTLEDKVVNDIHTAVSERLLAEFEATLPA